MFYRRLRNANKALSTYVIKLRKGCLLVLFVILYDDSATVVTSTVFVHVEGLKFNPPRNSTACRWVCALL